MEILLGTIENSSEGQKITFIEEISADTHNKLKSYLQVINRYNSIIKLHRLFIYNFIELSQFFELVTKQLSENQRFLLQDNHNEIEQIHLHANRLFLNFLSSFRTHIDHTETYLKRKFGNDSAESSAFIEKTNILFENHFEYRFMCKLRNYAQHCGLPISRITYKISKDKNNERNWVLNLNPLFDRDELLEKYKEWGNFVKKDLLAKPEEFPVMWTVKFFYQQVETLFDEVDLIERISVMNSIDYIGSICKKLNSENLEVCIFSDFKLSKPNSYENSTFSNVTIPMNLIAEIRDKFNSINL